MTTLKKLVSREMYRIASEHTDKKDTRSSKKLVSNVLKIPIEVLEKHNLEENTGIVNFNRKKNKVNFLELLKNNTDLQYIIKLVEGNEIPKIRNKICKLAAEANRVDVLENGLIKKIMNGNQH